MGITVTEFRGSSSKNRVFPGPRQTRSVAADVESARRSFLLDSIPSAFGGDSARRVRALVVFTLAVFLVFLMSGRAGASSYGGQIDSDGDGLSDVEERSGSEADPLAGDTDGDGLPDEVEVELGTDPLEVDSDGDGFGDASEYLAGSDPLIRADTPYGMVATDIPAVPTSAGLVTIPPQPLTDPKAIPFDESQSGRSPLFPLFISLASAGAVGLAFLLALVPQVGSTIETNDFEDS